MIHGFHRFRLLGSRPGARGETLRAGFQLGLAMALVGANVVAGRVLAQALPIPLILFLRCLLASVVVAPFAGVAAPGLIPSGRMLVSLVLQAATGTLLYNTALLAGLRRTGALEAGLVLSSLPAVVAIGAFLLLGERFDRRRWLAALLAAGALVSLTLGRFGGAGGGSLAGNALVFLGVCGEGSYVLLTKRMPEQIGVERTTFWMQVFSTLLLLPLAAPFLTAAGFAGMTWPIALLLVFHGLTASVLSPLLWYRGIRHVPASVAGVFTTLLPATTALLAVLFLGEALTTGHLLGFALMLASILLATLS